MLRSRLGHILPYEHRQSQAFETHEFQNPQDQCYK